MKLIIDKQYASFWLRFGAFSIDWIILTLFTIILNYFTSLIFGTWMYLAYVQLIGYSIIIYFYNIYFIYKFGATPGKKFVGIKVEKAEGSLTLVDCVRREILLKPISVLFFGFGILYMFFNPKKQTYYDYKLHFTVIVYKQLSKFRRTILFIFGVVYILYLSSWIPLFYTVTNAQNEQNKLDLINEIQQKQEIVHSLSDHDDERFIELYNESNVQLSQKMIDLCKKRFQFLVDKKENCVFEDLSFNLLNEIDNDYEKVINRIVDLQNQVEFEKRN